MDIKNKRIVFLGDSITEHGHYLYNLRSYFHNNKINCEVYNRGIGGNRADMIEYLINEEVVAIKPDYCFICFGVNDLGIWLYDSFKTFDDKLLAERAERDARYINGMATAVKILKQNNIMPILMSPFLVNENLEEKPDIPTLGDNQEKADFIGPWFYKKATFKNINNALYGYSLKLKELAERENVLFYDNYSALKAMIENCDGAHGADGLHYTEIGQALIAKGILQYLGFKDVPDTFAKDDINDELFELEQEERSIAFIRFNTYNKIHGRDVSFEQMHETIISRLNEPDLPDWKIKKYDDFIKYYGKFDELIEKVIEKTKAYVK